MVRDASGPFYLQANSDPDYAYLMNGLNLLHGDEPSHVDHPGTTLQIVIAGALKALHILRSEPDLVKDVLRHPEWYLARTQWLLLAAFFASSLVLGATVLHRTGSLAFAMLAQSAPLLDGELIVALSRVFPESLTITLVNALFISLTAVWTSSPESRSPRGRPWLLGATCAALVVTKVLSAPLAIIPMLALGFHRRRLAYLAALVLFTALLLIPVYRRLPYLLGWLMQNATHSGRYGKGQAGFLEWNSYWSNVLEIAKDAPLLILLGLLALSAFTWRRPTFASAAGKRTTAAIGLSIFGVIAVCAKAPASHYLVPALALLGYGWMLVLDQLCPRLSVDAAAARAIAAGLILIPAALTVRGLHDRLQLEAPSVRAASEAADHAARFGTNGQVVATYRASSQAYALAFGNTFAGYPFTSLLRELYPRNYDYNPWGDNLSRFSYDSPRSDLILLDGVILAHGTDLTEERIRQMLAHVPGAAMAKRLANKGGEHFYLIELRESTD